MTICLVFVQLLPTSLYLSHYKEAILSVHASAISCTQAINPAHTGHEQAFTLYQPFRIHLDCCFCLQMRPAVRAHCSTSSWMNKQTTKNEKINKSIRNKQTTTLESAISMILKLTWASQLIGWADECTCGNEQAVMNCKNSWRTNQSAKPTNQ